MNLNECKISAPGFGLGLASTDWKKLVSIRGYISSLGPVRKTQRPGSAWKLRAKLAICSGVSLTGSTLKLTKATSGQPASCSCSAVIWCWCLEHSIQVEKKNEATHTLPRRSF